MSKLIDYTKRKKENPKQNIYRCPICDKFGKMEEMGKDKIRFIHAEKTLLLYPIPILVHDMPKIFLEQYKNMKKG